MFKKRTLLSITISFLLYSNLAAANLPSSQIEQMQQYINQQSQAQLDLLKTLVNINSGSTNIEGVQAVGELLKPQFEALGFKTYWVDEPASMQRAGTFLAERKGSKGKPILLIGHLDTVFPKNAPFQPFQQNGNIATGQGTGDDKGGDVVILYALKALNAVHELDGRTITVVLTGDEESSGKPSRIARKPLIAAAKNKQIALEFECASTLNSAVVARRGITDWTLTTTGQGGHSSEIFKSDVGDGAIFEIARILTSMRTELTGQPHITFSPGIILGGTRLSFDDNESSGTAAGKPNVIAAQALVKGDLRFLTEQQKNAAEATMQKIVSQHLPITSAMLRFTNGLAGMAPSAGNLALLEEYSQISQQLGYGPVTAIDPDLRGASDISFVANSVPANLAGLGPVCSNPHSAKEQIDVSSLKVATLRTAVLIFS